MRSWIPAWALAALLGGAALAGCGETEQAGEVTVEEAGSEAAPASPHPELDAASLQTVATTPFQAAAGAEPGQAIGGEARVLSADTATGGEGFHLQVRLDGLSPGEHAWHIHAGPCGVEAPVVVAFTPTAELEPVPGASPLVPVADGRAEQTILVPADRLTLQRLRAQEHSVHVHRSGGVDHGPTVACADL